MKNCIIFGAGFTGKNAYSKLNLVYHVLAYADNSSGLWGKTVNGLPILEPKKLKEYQQKYGCDIVICSDYFPEIQKQLLGMGMESIRIIEPSSYMLYEYMPYNLMEPVNRILPYMPYKKEGNGLHILFVQQHPCIRTHKIAEILLKRGIGVSLAYTAESPEVRHPTYAGFYTNRCAFFSISDLISYVNESGYDLVHCSNEPDSLTNIMLLTNKPVVHDTHDIMSINYKVDRDMLTLEYLANVKSQGLIYVNEYNLQLAAERFGVKKDKAIVIENRPSQMAIPDKSLKKLSAADGEIHCVFEGGIHKNKDFYLYMEDVWMKLAQSGVHVHFYTQADAGYCKSVEKRHCNIHYEGNVDSKRLLTELTQYDCGLLLFNDVPENRLKLDTSLPNKLYEYLAAGLPEVVGDVKSYRDFVEKYSVGGYLDFQQDIKEQISEIVQIKIADNFIQKNQLTMESQADKLIDFYQKTILRYRNGK